MVEAGITIGLIGLLVAVQIWWMIAGIVRLGRIATAIETLSILVGSKNG